MEMKNMMRKKDDCFRCCIAELLDIPYEDVPDFFGDEIENKFTEDHIYKRLADWLEKKGIARLYIPCTSKNFISCVASQNMSLIGVFKKENIEYSHAVVLRTTDRGTSWDILDPKPNSDYHFHDLCAIEVFLPIYKNIN
jgi:hypothetical protein